MIIAIRSFLSAALLLSACPLWAGTFTFSGTNDKDTFLYQAGEKMTFSVQLFDDSHPAAGTKLTWTRTGDDGKTETGEAVSSDTSPLIVSTSLDTPGFVLVQVTALGGDGKPLLDAKNQPVRFSGGAGVETDKLRGVPEPADFDAFWAAQKARLAEVPVKATLTEIPATNPDFVAYDIRVDCPGGKPVSGYFTKPKNATPKSLKAHATFQGYGVASATQGCENGTLFLNINAHGIENGRDPAFYQALKDGELKSYAFNNQENAKPETAYFNGMVLRVLRALEFLKSQPEWNGTDLLVSGGSQGGFQTMAAAALDKDVTSCQVSIPWCCDLGGITLGRLKGWRPDWTEALGYYDEVNMAKRVKCPTTIAAGLGDTVCPPSGICVLYNTLTVPKQLEFTQGRTHPYNPPGAQKFVVKGN